MMDTSPAGQLAVLLTQTAASWFMTGLIWTMQVLNYPLLALIDAGDVPRYEQAHNRRFIWLVGPGVAVALASAVVMLGWRPPAVPLAVPVAALVLLAVIVVSTARQGAPSHALCIRIHRQGRVGDPAVWPPMLNVSLCD